MGVGFMQARGSSDERALRSHSVPDPPLGLRSAGGPPKGASRTGRASRGSTLRPCLALSTPKPSCGYPPIGPTICSPQIAESAPTPCQITDPALPVCAQPRTYTIFAPLLSCWIMAFILLNKRRPVAADTMARCLATTTANSCTLPMSALLSDEHQRKTVLNDRTCRSYAAKV